MQVNNLTRYKLDGLLCAAIEGIDHGELTVEVKYCPTGSKRSTSGTYYRWMPERPEGRLIRLRINRTNRYPITIPFKTSSYYKKTDGRGREITYQRLRHEKFHSAEHLLVAIFLHEFSHYMDHMEDRNGRYKQTKADKFAVERLESLGIISFSNE
jgi:hypothetical protein